jgi:DNA repair exonuclease SbcCD ATPase subunit
MDIFEKMIQNSYDKSGNNSVRVLLMTATPYTDDPMEMMKLMNLLRTDALDTDFDDFSKKYLDNAGHFTKAGKSKFQDSIAGYISYINRSQDARNFAHPIIEPVYVPMTYNEHREPSKELDARMKELTAMMKDTRAIIREEKVECKEHTKAARTGCNADHKEKMQSLKEALKTKKADCKRNKDCIEKVKSKYDSMIEKHKSVKKDIVAKCINKQIGDVCKGLAKAQEDLAKDKEEKLGIRSRIREVLDENKELNNEAKHIRGILRSMRDRKNTIAIEKKKLRPELKKKPELIKNIKELNVELKDLSKEYLDLKGKVINNNNKKKLNRVKIFRAVLPDASMRDALTKKCGV